MRVLRWHVYIAEIKDLHQPTWAGGSEDRPVWVKAERQWRSTRDLAGLTPASLMIMMLNVSLAVAVATLSL
jgi:hypothetical protein